MESVKSIKSSQELIDYLIVCVTSNLKIVRVSVGVVDDFDFLSFCAISHRWRQLEAIATCIGTSLDDEAIVLVGEDFVALL
jgi:hypothetical protein